MEDLKNPSEDSAVFPERTSSFSDFPVLSPLSPVDSESGIGIGDADPSLLKPTTPANQESLLPRAWEPPADLPTAAQRALTVAYINGAFDPCVFLCQLKFNRVEKRKIKSLDKNNIRKKNRRN